MPTVSYASGRTLYLATKLTPAGTLTVTTDPGPTNGRLYGANDNQVEWIEYTSVTASGDNFILGGLTRDLDPVAIPATSNSTGKTWLATQKFVLVSMHDQLWDRQQGGPFASFTTAQLLARTNKQVGEMFRDSTQNMLVYWNGSAYIALAATGAVANATTTSVGGIELPTDSEVVAGSDTGSLGPLAVQPSQHAKTIQSGTFVYGADAGGDDTYVVALTPVLTAYTTGQRLRFKATTANTGACSVDFGPGVKNIKLVDGSDPLDGDIAANSTNEFLYDGTNMVLQSVAVRASSAEALTGTNTVKFMTPSITKDSLKDSIGVYSSVLSSTSNTADTGDLTAVTSGFVTIVLNSNGVSARITATLTYGAASPSSTVGSISTSDSYIKNNSWTFPVKKGYHYRVLCSDGANSTNSTNVYFTPNA